MSVRSAGNRLQACGYATVLSCLSYPRTIYYVARANSLQEMTARHLCQEFVALGIAHVAGWETGPSGRWLVPSYIAGPGENAKRFNKNGSVSHLGFANRIVRPRSEMIFFASAIRALKEHAHNGKTLAEETGCSHGTALKLLRHMHQLKLIYVAEWQLRARGGAGAPMYRLGKKRNAPRPTATPKNELFRIYGRERYQQRRATALNMAVCGVRSFTTERHKTFTA